VGVVPAADLALAEELGGFVRVVEVDGDQGAVTLVEGGRHCGDSDGEDVERCGEMWRDVKEMWRDVGDLRGHCGSVYTCRIYAMSNL